MKCLIGLIFVFSYIFSPPESIKEYLDREIKDIDVSGTLVNKKAENSMYVFEIKIEKTNEIKKIVIPETTHNSKSIYEFIVPGDYFFKVKGELKFRLGHKFDENIEVRHFELIQ
jgi:CTP-dependent riboflavin kinase